MFFLWIFRTCFFASARAQGVKAAAASRMSALKELMETAGLSLEQGAEVVADVVNAMVVK